MRKSMVCTFESGLMLYHSDSRRTGLAGAKRKLGEAIAMMAKAARRWRVEDPTTHARSGH